MRALVDTCVMAIRSGMDCIVTRNAKDYIKASVKVYEPDVFLGILEKEK